MIQRPIVFINNLNVITIFGPLYILKELFLIQLNTFSNLYAFLYFTEAQGEDCYDGQKG